MQRQVLVPFRGMLADSQAGQFLVPGWGMVSPYVTDEADGVSAGAATAEAHALWHISSDALAAGAATATGGAQMRFYARGEAVGTSDAVGTVDFTGGDPVVSGSAAGTSTATGHHSSTGVGFLFGRQISISTSLLKSDLGVTILT